MNFKNSLFFLLFPFMATSQCDQFSYYFSSDSELKDFIDMNPECNTIPKLEIAGPDITNLALLSHFDTIGSLTISHNSTISNLDFLETIEVSRGISLQSLDNLESLSKFEEVQTQSLNIYNCPLLNAFELTGEYYNNISLQSPNLEATVKHDISIGHLTLSQNVSFNSLAEVKVSQLKLHNATKYKSFTAITNNFRIDTLTTLQIWGAQDTFNSEGFPDSMVCRSFEIAGFNNLNISGFESKTAFFRSFNLHSISDLKDLVPFDKMHTEDRVSIQNCDSISSLDGIPISEYIDAISISNNLMLTDIQDIMKVNDTYGLSLIDNPLLATCNNRLVCDLIEAPNSATRVKKILNFDYPTASGWSIRQNFSNLKVGIRIFFVIRRFYAKTSFYDSDASIGEFKY